MARAALLAGSLGLLAGCWTGPVPRPLPTPPDKPEEALPEAPARPVHDGLYPIAEAQAFLDVAPRDVPFHFVGGLYLDPEWAVYVQAMTPYMEALEGEAKLRRLDYEDWEEHVDYRQKNDDDLRAALPWFDSWVYVGIGAVGGALVVGAAAYGVLLITGAVRGP